jgi:hypothetical protein
MTIMAVHHDKLVKFLRDHSDIKMVTPGGNSKSPYNWAAVGSDPASIAGAFRMIADEIVAGRFD